MKIELLGQFGQRLLTPYGSQGHLRFESRRVVPAWSSAHRFSCSAAILAAVRQKLHLSNLFKNPEPALWPETFDELFSDLDGCGWRGGPVGRINKGPKCYDPSRCCCKAHADYTPECPWGVLVCSPDVVVVCSPEKHGRLKRAGALGRQTTNVR